MHDPDLVIRARGLSKRFGQLNAVDGLDLSVARAEVFGFSRRFSARTTSQLRGPPLSGAAATSPAVGAPVSRAHT